MPATPYAIDAARAEDVPKLVELLLDLFGTELDFTADVTAQTRGLTLLIAQPPAQATVLVARDGGGQVIGMGSAQLVISTSEGAPSAWFEDIVVHRDHRRAGMGRALLDALLAWALARGATRAQLVADRENIPAEMFYNGLGWKTTQLTVRRWMIERAA